MAAALEPRLREIAIERSILSFQDVVEAGVHYNLETAVVPGILKHLDLPGVVQLLNGRRVIIISPVHPNGTPLFIEEAHKKLGPIASTVQITARGEGWPIGRVIRP